jgi:hypothetical protein
MKKFLIAVGALSTACIGATAVLAQQARPFQAPHSASGQTCLQISRLYSWNVLDASTLVVKDTAQRKYRVALNGNCAHSTFYDKVIFDPITTSSMGCVGSGDRVNLSDRGGSVERCLVENVTPYTE